jgi:hypothetical protein
MAIARHPASRFGGIEGNEILTIRATLFLGQYDII